MTSKRSVRMCSKFPYINSERLINAIKKRSELYKKEYGSQHIVNATRKNLWYEVCRETYADWDQWDAWEQEDRYGEILKRWKNLRTCFIRELRRKENPQTNDKSREYEFFRQMLFLKKYIGRRTNYFVGTPDDDRDPSDPLHRNIKIENDEEGNRECSGNDDERYDYCDVDIEVIDVNENGEATEEAAIDELTEEGIMNIFEKCKKKEKVDKKKVTGKSNTEQLLLRETPEARIMSMLTECKKLEDNPDRQFLLSLVPTFQKLSDKQKADVKIEILKVLKNITYQND